MTFTGWKVSKEEAKELLGSSLRATKADIARICAEYDSNAISYDEMNRRIAKANSHYDYLSENLVITA